MGILHPKKITWKGCATKEEQRGEKGGLRGKDTSWLYPETRQKRGGAGKKRKKQNPFL